MFLRFVKTLCIAAVLAALAAACSSSPEKADSAASKNKEAAAGVTEAVAPAPPAIPPEATQQFEKALTLLSAGDYGPAAAEFQRLSTAYPDYSGPLTNLGIVYLKTGKLAEAEKALKAATERGDSSAAAFNQLGIVYRRLGRFKEADAAYSHALQIDANYALAHLNLGVLCDMYLQEPQRALEEYERYLQLVPNPDARVAAWIKELRGRAGAANKPVANGGA